METEFTKANINAFAERLANSMDRSASQKAAEALVAFFHEHQHNSEFTEERIASLNLTRYNLDFVDLVNSICLGQLSWFLFLKLRPFFVEKHPELYCVFLILWMGQPIFNPIWENMGESKTILQDLLNHLQVFENPQGPHTIINYLNYQSQHFGVGLDGFDGFLFSHKFI